MAITRKKKEELVGQITELVKGSKSIVFADYQGLSVSEINGVRSALKENDLQLKVIKHSLFKIAAQKAGISVESEDLKGRPIAYVFSNDEVAGAKAIHDFSKKNEKLQIVGGALEGKIVSISELKELATLPSREELYAKVVGSLASPLRGISSVLQGNLRGLVYALGQIAESKK